MNRETLDAMLDGDDIFKTLDVKTLVLDIVREMPQEELLAIFWDKLPGLEPEFVRDYLFMKRS